MIDFIFLGCFAVLVGLLAWFLHIIVEAQEALDEQDAPTLKELELAYHKECEACHTEECNGWSASGHFIAINCDCKSPNTGC